VECIWIYKLYFYLLTYLPPHNSLGTWLKSHEIKKNSVVTGIEPTASGLLGQRRNRSDNKAP